MTFIQANGNSLVYPAVLADLTVAGGAVTELTSGAITLTEGKVYNWFSQIIAATPSTNGTFYPILNSDSTLANYRQGLMTSGGSHLETSTLYGGIANAADSAIMSGTIRQFNGKVFTEYYFISMNTSGLARKGNTGYWHASIATVTGFSIYSQYALGIDNGSKLKIWEA